MSIDPTLAGSLNRLLLGLFDAQRRDLPWRSDRSPYRVWVSEIMLQQTQVKTVVPYFESWMERLPDLAALAAADQEDVMKSWEGLGYYSRARNLHKAARLVRETMAGQLPQTAAGLKELPGIGEYTSGAIASIAYGERVPAVDGNVRRVLSRLFDLENPTPKELNTVAAELVPADRPGDWNEALMEFGATVCKPRAPSCGVCPVSRLCASRLAGTVALRPPPRKKAKVRRAVFAVTVPLRRDGAIYMVRRPPRGLLGGLWEFPQRELSGTVAQEHVELSDWALKPGEQLAELADIPHVFTHIRATYRTIVVRASAGRCSEEARWFRPGEVAELALPVAQQEIFRRTREILAEEELWISGRLDSMVPLS